MRPLLCLALAAAGLLAQGKGQQVAYRSRIAIYDTAAKSSRVIFTAGAVWEAPNWSPDGKWIYFNSSRSGGWDVWRVPASGGGPNDAKAERVTSDDLEDWFPHLTPDGKRMVWLSFPKGTPGHGSRMEGVQLRMTSVPPGRIETLATFFGGQGTINVNSWSPDSKKFAYVIYEPIAR